MSRESSAPVLTRELREARDPLTSRGRVRGAPLPWRLAVGLIALALAGPCLVGGPDRGPDAADRSLLGNHPHWVQSIAFTADGRRLASAGFDGSVYLWDVPGAAFDRILGTVSPSISMT